MMTTTTDHPFTLPTGWTARQGRASDRGFHVNFAGPNGYGASVILNRYSYGADSGLYELAVLDAKGDLTYGTPVTDDVIGWLTVEGVNEALANIAALTPESVRAGQVERRRVAIKDRIAELKRELESLKTERDSM